MALQVFEAKFKLYAESQAEVDALQAELLAFVRDKREQGIAITANKLIRALQQFRTNVFVNNYLK